MNAVDLPHGQLPCPNRALIPEHPDVPMTLYVHTAAAPKQAGVWVETIVATWFWQCAACGLVLPVTTATDTRAS